MSLTPVPFMIGTLVVLVAFFGFDLFLHGRRPHVPSTAECLRHIGLYIGAALVFGALLWLVAGGKPAVEFYSGWLTEYSLSIDNLFIFVLIMGNFAVPKRLQKYVLSVGITIALVLRGIFILLGAAIIARFTWVFLIFGLFLLITAIRLVTDRKKEEKEYEEPGIVRFLRRFMKTTNRYEGKQLRVVVKGVTYFTPLLVVFLTIGVTDLLFAFDSIPAIFGLTKDPFIVFTANVFALLGLQQLYFLLGSLIDKLVYLPVGLAVVLAFIGGKLILEALSENSLPFINGGRPIAAVPAVPTWLSLAVIVVSLGLSALASVVAARRQDQRSARPGDASPQR